MRLRGSVLILEVATTLLLGAAALAAQESAPSKPKPKLVVPGQSQQSESAQSAASSSANSTSANTANPNPAKEVSVLAVVRDKKGQPVTNLSKQDFVLEQDGRAQTITQVSQPAELPLTIGVVADTGSEQRKALGDERKAGTDFLNRVLRQGQDRGFVLHFDREVELLQDVTASRDKLAKGMDGISTESSVPHPPEHGERHFSFGGQVLYDALFLSADEVLKGEKGRKAIVLFSDGVDSSSKTSLQRAIEAAQRANVQVYCVYVTPAEREGDRSDDRTRPGYPRGGYPGGGYPRFPGGGPYPGGGYPGGPYPGGGYPPGRREPEPPREKKGEGKRILQQIADETGGRFFELSKKMNAAQIFAQIEDEMRHQYSLSYTPDSASGGFHKLHVSTRKPDLTVQARAGVYSEKE